MVTNATTPFRLVRCPKCREVLPEAPNVPVYSCGGCGALLQAKNRKREGKRREAGQQDTRNIESSHEAAEDCNNGEDGYGNCKEEEARAIDCDTEGPRVESDVYSSKDSLLSAQGPISPHVPLRESTPLGQNGIGSVRSHAYEDQFSDSYDRSIKSTHLKSRREQFLADSVRNAGSQHQPQGKKMEEKGWDWARNVARVKRNPQDGYASESFPNQDYEFDCQQQENMKLLRVIHQLQDKLDKKCYNHKEQTWDELMNSRRCRLGSNSAKLSRDIDNHCLHCHPLEMMLSVPLPLVLCHTNGICDGYDCCNPKSSFQSRPKFSTRSHDAMRKCKHFRPKAGGAPLITCYCCSQLLQLPEDFVPCGRTYCKLRCGACSTILKFSVQNRTHIVPSSYHAYTCVGRNMSHDCSFSRNQFQNKYKDPLEAHGSSKFKCPSEIEKSRSPLHRLMGYSSPSLLIRGSVAGTSS